MSLGALAFLALILVLGPAPARAATREVCEQRQPGRLVAYVVDVSGAAWAGDPDCPDTRRPVVCGDLLLEGELLETSETGRVEILASGRRVAIEASAALRLGLDGAGGPALDPVRGRVHAVTPDDTLRSERAEGCPDSIGDARDRFDPTDVAAAGEDGLPPPGAGLGPDLEPCEVGGDCTSIQPPPPPPPVVPPIVPPEPPKPPAVVESAPVFRPPPGLPVRPLPR